MDSFQLGAGAAVNVGQPNCGASYLIIPTPVLPGVSADAGVATTMIQSNTRYCGNSLGPINNFAAGVVRSEYFGISTQAVKYLFEMPLVHIICFWKKIFWFIYV